MPKAKISKADRLRAEHDAFLRSLGAKSPIQIEGSTDADQDH